MIRKKLLILSTKYLWNTMARYAQTASLLCSVKSVFATLGNKRALHSTSFLPLVFFIGGKHWPVKPFSIFENNFETRN